MIQIQDPTMTAQMKWRQMKFAQVFILFMISAFVNAQNYDTRWKDHFSYSSIHHIWEIHDAIFCSADNGLFSYNPTSGEIQKISKVNDLNDVGISAFHYNPELDLLLVGYQSGEMDMLGPDENVNLLEIPLHQAYTGSKAVNHISSVGSTAIISGEFGLASFSLDEFEFLETTYFSTAGVYFGVKETAILNNIIFAASDKGVYTHELDSFIANFVSWNHETSIPTTAFQQIVEFQGNIIASTGNSVYRFDGNNWTMFGNYPNLLDITTNGNTLSFTSAQNVITLNESFAVIDNIAFPYPIRTGLKIGGTTYAGSLEYGLLQGQNSIMPDGPFNNRSWAITAFKENIWISPGGMVNFNTPQQNKNGYYHFDGTIWNHVSSENLFEAKDIVDVEVNPSNINEIYVSPWFEYTSWPASETNRIGLLRVENNIAQENIINTNTNPNGFWRLGGSTYDEMGNLWVGQSYVAPQGLTVMNKKTPSGGWQSINLNAMVSDAGARKPVIYQDYAFMALPRAGGVKVTNMSNIYSITANTNSGNLPSNNVYSVAIDKNGYLWIGTELGLRVIYNPLETITQDYFEAQPIIIEQDGIPEALFTDVQINDIEVDESNQKWIATQTSGVYCVSEDGTETIYHFTTSNSPLPSNSINDIETDSSTGVVYFATEKGVVSFQSDAIEVGESFGDVYAYPNPVRPGFNGNVVIRGLPNDADVRIVDVVGNLIYKTKASGGSAVWDTKNSKGKLVASGVYLVLMTNKDASESKQTKIAIIR